MAQRGHCLPLPTNLGKKCLHGSTLLDELRKLGYDVDEIGETERILPGAIVEEFVTRADGELELLTEGLTKPVAQTVTHAGIVRTKQFAFSMP